MRKYANVRSQTHQVVLQALPYFEARSLILAPNRQESVISAFWCVVRVVPRLIAGREISKIGRSEAHFLLLKKKGSYKYY